MMKLGGNNISFDEKAGLYDGWYQTLVGTLCDRLEKEAIFSLSSVQPDEFVLDVGCGTGNYLLELAKRGATVIGVDSSSNMLAIARGKLRRQGYQPQLELAKAEALPFEDETFDMVLSVLLLEFVASPQKVVGEMFRVVKPGGRLVIGTLNRYSIWALKRKLANALGLAEHVKAAYLTKKHLSSLLLSESDCWDSNGNLAWRRMIYFPPSENRLLLRKVPVIENIGHHILPGFGAFLAVRANKTLGNGQERK